MFQNIYLVCMNETWFTPFPELSTERLYLRKLREEDAPEMFRFRSDERILKHIKREPAKSQDEALEFIRRINKNVEQDESVFWGISLKNETTLIGTICLWNISREDFRAEIGFLLHPDHQGKGCMQEALKKIIDYGFGQLKLHSICAFVNPYNSASIKLLHANGFMKEGHFKECIFFDGEFHDWFVYSLINTH